MIEIKDIEKLAELSRIRISESEKKDFLKDIESILGYVDQIKKVAVSERLPDGKSELKNVFREDAEPDQPGQFASDLLNCAPEQENGYFKVKKIM